MPEIVLKFEETVCLKDPNGRTVAEIKLEDDGKYGIFLIVMPNEAAIPTRFRCYKP